MKKLKVYLDTSVIGGCFDSEFELDSNQIINNVELGIYEGIISVITIDEIEGAPEFVKSRFNKLIEFLTVLDLNDEVIKLTDEYLARKVVTSRFKEDALHIAFATVYNIDVLVSWNFKHIVNLNKIKQFNSINISQGYQTLEIRSPRELFYDE